MGGGGDVTGDITDLLAVDDVTAAEDYKDDLDILGDLDSYDLIIDDDRQSKKLYSKLLLFLRK